MNHVCVYVYVVSYTMDTIYFTWFEKPLDIEPNLQLPQFALRGYAQNDCSQNYTGGSYHILFNRSTVTIFLSILR